MTSFFTPSESNRVDLDNFSVAAASTFDWAPFCDGHLRATWKRIDREGLIEFLPNAKEQVNQKEGELALSRFFGPDKADLMLTYTDQDISPELTNPPRRDRRFLGARFTYQLLRPLRGFGDPYQNHFATRGWHFFGGVLDDREHFGVVELQRSDYYVGTSLKGLGRIDLTLQPTVFKVRVTGDPTQSSSQVRTDVTLVYRLLDEEREPGIPPASFLGLHPAFFHLVIPLRHDSARDGLTAFENDRFGIGLDAKFFALDLAQPQALNARFSASTFLIGLHYSREKFPQLGKSVNLVDLSISLGF